MTHYILLDDHNVRPCHFMEWAEQFEKMSKENSRHVGHDLLGDYRVSTVWMGLDHSFCGKPPPLLFETMIFDGESLCELYMDRYTTWDEAVEGHKKAIQWVNEGATYDE